MNVVNPKNIESKLIKYQNNLVLLDSDVTQPYSVKTRNISKTIKNNLDKFPSGYVIELSQDEKNELVENFHQFNSLKHSTVNPKVFAEKGLCKLATIIKSKVTTKSNQILENIIEIETITKFKLNLSFAKVSKSVKKIKKDA